MRDPLNEIQIAIEHETCRVIAMRFTLENERHRNMSRLTEKLKQASGVVGRQTARIEAKADAIIAREPEIEKQTDNAFALHDALLNDAARGLDALERELANVSNDPLGSSGESSQGQQTTDRVALGPHPDQPAAGFAGVVDEDKIRDQVNKAAESDITEVAEGPVATFRAAE